MESLHPHIPTYRRVWQIAYPIILGGLAENIINVTDTAFVGRLGEEALGSVGLGSLYYYTFVLIAIGLVMGLQILVGRRNGEQNFTAIGEFFDNALYLFAAIAVVLFVLLETLSPFILGNLIKSKSIVSNALVFIHYRSFGILFICLSVVFRAFYIGITETKIIIFITGGMASLNVLLGYLLIFGNAGFPALGIKGSAIASITSECAALTGYIIYTLTRKSNGRFRMFRFRKPDLTKCSQILAVGSPLMLQTWISVSSWFVFFLLIEKMGERALAVSSIVKSMYVVCMVPIWGFGSATNTLVSNLMGEKRMDVVLKVVIRILLISVSLGLCIAMLLAFFPKQVISLYSSDGSLLTDTVGPLLVIAFALVLMSAMAVLFNAVSGTGSTRISLLIELTTLMLYMSFILLSTQVWSLGLVYIWMSEWLYMGSMSFFSMLYLFTGKWKKVRI